MMNTSHKINLEYLNHDTLTDIISASLSPGSELNGYFISIERVHNANMR
jgi:ssRNA-specific RNase YbeY (16S rRNA maturation enzyme)